MWRSKKFIIVALLAAVLLVGSIGGIVFAQTENEDDSQPEAQYGALLNRVCEIYEKNTGVTIDQEVLADAFAEARGEMQGEKPDGRRFRTPMAGHAGISGILGEKLGIEIDQDDLKEALADAREAVQAGADRQEVMAEVLGSFGIDVEELKAARAEAQEAWKELRAENQNGERPFKRPGFRGHGVPRGWGRLHPAE